MNTMAGKGHYRPFHNEDFMKQSEIKEVIDLNFRILTLLGIATSMLIDARGSLPKSQHYKYDWFLQALNDVVYSNKPLPHMPDRELL